MEIRSVTLFCEPDFAPAAAAAFFADARTAFPYAVQSTRLATPPFPDWLPMAWDATPAQADRLSARAAEFAARWQAAGAGYVSLGPVLLRHPAAWLEAIPALLGATDVLFAAVEIADTHQQLDAGRCRQMAGLIRQVSTLRPDGFGNLYLAALANCPPGAPFFPVAYHAGGPPTFALAIEAADLARTAVQGCASLSAARYNLVAAIEEAAAALKAAAEALAARHRIAFHGLDFSLAPFPTDGKSLAGALEDLGAPHVGASGSLFAAAFLTEAIQRARFPRCGFSGLMLPVLEDSVLAARAAAGQVSLNDLLLYAAVCGVGLDTVPLPGAVSQDSLTAVLLDVAALATRLDKPLTARLMPLPGLEVGDPVHFDFPYFADSRVMPIAGDKVGDLLSAARRLELRRYVREEK